MPDPVRAGAQPPAIDPTFATFIIERMPVALSVYDAGGNAVFANPMARRILGLDSDEFQSRSASDERWMTIHEDGTPFQPLDYPINTSLRTGQSCHEVVMGILRPDDNYTWVLINSEPILDTSATLPRGVVAIFIDITERIHLKKQLYESQKLDAIGKLSGGVAHDFRNILQAITTSCEMLIRNPVEDRTRRHVDVIRKATSRGSDLTQQLLTVARRRVVQSSPLDLGEVIESSVQIFRPAIGAHIDVTTKIAPDLWRIHADASTMGQLLMNLVLNARDAMPGGGSLAIEARNFTADDTYARRHVDLVAGEYVLLSVTDTGTGISLEVQDQIFEPYFSTKDTGGHSGLGLAVVYGIVKQHDGRIWVYSEPGKGTSFKVFFPRHMGEQETVTAPESTLVSQGQGETVLLVDDDEFVREVLTEALLEHGYRVIKCSTPQEAIDTARTERIDLLLTDVVMPRMSGRQVAESMPGVKVVYMSGYTDDVVVHHSNLQAGARFLEKPVTIRELLRTVRAVLDE
jgi:two-component system, cell cycle sensor histidine kinase and response regulator CckA